MPYGRKDPHRLARTADTGIVTTARVKRRSDVLRVGTRPMRTRTRPWSYAIALTI